MYKILLICFFFLSLALKAQDLPLGYIQHFEFKFNQKAQAQLLSSEHTIAKVSNGVCYLNETKDSLETFAPPATWLIDNHIFGDFILDMRIKFSTTESDSLSGLFIITGLRDSSNYYFIQLNTEGASFHKMYKGEITAIDTNSNFILKADTWHNIRLTRDILDRTITISSGKYNALFYDPNLVMGYFGIGLNDYSLAINNLIVWAPTSISKPAPVFGNSVNK